MVSEGSPGGGWRNPAPSRIAGDRFGELLGFLNCAARAEFLSVSEHSALSVRFKIRRLLEQFDSTLRRFAKCVQLLSISRDVPDYQSFIAHLQMRETVNILVKAIERG